MAESKREKVARIAIAPAAILLLAPTACDRKTLGEIEFFGYQGLNVEAVRSALPFREGDPFPPRAAASSNDLERIVKEKVKQAIGQEPTDVSFVCCDASQRFMVYIGLPGKSFQAVTFRPAPIGTIRFAPEVMKLQEQADKAWAKAVMSGHATEDDSEGYALTADPAARKAQLAIREYALRNEATVVQVLASSADPIHRAFAAEALGYGRQSPEQVDALVSACLDPSDAVRNNATRALAVLAGAKPNLAERIPAGPFIGLLKSGSWSDHNKVAFLLTALTERRDPKILSELRSGALDPLLEMARWRSQGHAEAAWLLLGRIAGIEEERLRSLIEARQLDAILRNVDQRPEQRR